MGRGNLPHLKKQIQYLFLFFCLFQNVRGRGNYKSKIWQRYGHLKIIAFSNIVDVKSLGV